jgi:hypothetical protein
MSELEDKLRAELDEIGPEGLRIGSRLLAAVWDRLEVPPIQRGAPVPYEVQLPTLNLCPPWTPRCVPALGVHENCTHSWPAAGPRDARLPRG